MQMAVEKPNPVVFRYKFQEIFNSGIFTELTEHTESKTIIFTGKVQNMDPWSMDALHGPGP